VWPVTKDSIQRRWQVADYRELAFVLNLILFPYFFFFKFDTWPENWFDSSTISQSSHWFRRWRTDPPFRPSVYPRRVSPLRTLEKKPLLLDGDLLKKVWLKCKDISKKNKPKRNLQSETQFSLLHKRWHSTERSAASNRPNKVQRRMQKELRVRCTGRHLKSHALCRHCWQRRVQCKSEWIEIRWIG
jgi:hypothetical protein